MFKKLPAPLTILFIIIILAAGATWLIPAGHYDTLRYSDGALVVQSADSSWSLPPSQSVLDSLGIRVSLEKLERGDIRKPIAIPGTYQSAPPDRQGITGILMAPIKGIYDTVDIILFLLFIGGFMAIFNQSGALARGVQVLSYRMRNRGAILILILTLLFALGGGSYGMAEEALVFYPVLVPLFLAAGFDAIVPVAVIFGGCQIGTMASFTNPFSVIIASNLAGISWTDGLSARLWMFLALTGIFIVYTIRYARSVRQNPARSLAGVPEDYIAATPGGITDTAPLTGRDKWLLAIFLSVFVIMVYGVVALDWWLTEMTALFFAAALLMALIIRLPEKQMLKQFIKGAEEMLSVSLIVGVARGVTVVLQEGRITDTILHYCTQLAGQTSGSLLILAFMLVFFVLCFFISSTSGLAVLTMPIMGALAFAVGIEGKTLVNAYLYGNGIMQFVTPTGLILPSLALVRVPLSAWWKFIRPLLVILSLVSALFLVGSVMLQGG